MSVHLHLRRSHLIFISLPLSFSPLLGCPAFILFFYDIRTSATGFSYSLVAKKKLSFGCLLLFWGGEARFCGSFVLFFLSLAA
jgi:hypothetical protein